MESTTPPGEPEPPLSRPIVVATHRTKREWILIILLVVGLIVLGGLIWRQERHNKSNANNQIQRAVQLPPVSTKTPAVDATVLLADRQLVWDMAFLPSGQMLFTERDGFLRMYDKGTVTTVAQPADVYATGEGGMLGLAVDPAYAQNHYVYTCMDSTAPDIRVVRWRFAPYQKDLPQRQDIVTGITINTTTFPGRHSGCRLAFGPDGYLWIGTGDTAQGDTGIAPKQLGGKILRVDRNGKAAPGNLGGGFDSRIYSYGHRNVQGLAFFAHPKHGVLGVNIEHGSNVDDEVNELAKGNFGWAPPSAGYDESVPMTDTARFPDAIKPIWSSGNPTQAPSGAAFIHGAVWKGWDGALAIAVLKDQHLKILRLDANNKVIKEEKILDEMYGRLRSVIEGPDGSLYVATSNGNNTDKIIRVTPK